MNDVWYISEGLVCNHKTAVLCFFYLPSIIQQYISIGIFTLLHANRLEELLNHGFHHEHFTNNQGRRRRLSPSLVHEPERLPKSSMTDCNLFVSFRYFKSVFFYISWNCLNISDWTGEIWARKAKSRRLNEIQSDISPSFPHPFQKRFSAFISVVN